MTFKIEDRWDEYADLVYALSTLDSAARKAKIFQRIRDRAEAEAFFDWFQQFEQSDLNAIEPAKGIGGIQFIFAPGDRVGDWTIETIVGFGGMGEVYRVRRERKGFSQIAALKTVVSVDPVERDRFLEERRILSSLEHSGIGRFIDGGETPCGRPFMVVEIVEGQAITQYADAMNMGAAGCLGLVSALCRAVSHAHSRLILHRDIKPSNILVTKAGEVKLIDFGVGSALDDNILSSKIPVSENYAAPELDGSGPATVQSDIFALGRVLERIMTGHKGRAVNDLGAIISKATAPDPASRYVSMDSLHEDITALQKGFPVSAREPRLSYILGRFINRHRFAALATALATVSLVGGIIGTTVMAERAMNEAAAARAALAEAHQARLDQMFEARTLKGYRYALQSLYGRDEATGLRLPPNVIDATLRAIVEASLPRAQSGKTDDAFLIYAIGQNHMFRHDFDAAVDVLSRLDPEQLADPVLKMEWLSDLGHSLLELGREPEAADLAKRAIAIRVEIDDHRGAGWIQDHATIATVTGLATDRARLIDVLQTAISQYDPDLEDADHLSWMYNKLGTSLLLDKRYRDATQAFTDAFEVHRNQTALSPNDIVRATNLAQFQIYFDRDPDQPLTYLPDYLSLQTETFDNDPERHGFILGLMAEAKLLQGKWSDAANHAAAARNVLSDHRAYRAGWYFDVTIMLARALAGQGRNAEAQDVVAQLKRELPLSFPDGAPDLLNCKIRIAEALLDRTEPNPVERARQFCFNVTDTGLGSREIILTHLIEAEAIASQQ